MNSFRSNILLLCIILIATILRFYQLGVNPPSLTWDEVAWGYNAYSLGIDGRDEFGRFLPVSYIESFGDFKPPVYAYLDILPVKFFGLTEFAVRFPSAFFGVLTVLVTFFLTKRIFNTSQHAVYYAHSAAFVLAISPWHINLSRAAFEANVATFFIVSGVWLFLLGIQEKRWYLYLSVVSFVLSMYTFNTARIVAPFLGIVLAIGCYKDLLQTKKESIIAGIVGFLVLLPMLPFLFSPQASLRYKEVNIFSDPTVIERSNRYIENDGNTLWSKAIHNRRVMYAREYVRHYLDNLTPKFLFIKGDGNPKFSTQDVGQLYLWDLPFLLIGVLFLFRKREGYWWIIPAWLLISIIPAATARETPHALRIEAALPTFQILIAYGFVHVVFSRVFLKRIQYRYFVVNACLIFLFFNVQYYLHGYYNHYPRMYSGEWQYGYKDVIAYIEKEKEKYDSVFVTDKLGRPYIYFLFYNQTSPEEFRKTADVRRDVFGFVTVNSLGSHYFVREPAKAISAGSALYIDVPGSEPEGAQVLETFYLKNGKPVLSAYTL